MPKATEVVVDTLIQAGIDHLFGKERAAGEQAG